MSAAQKLLPTKLPGWFAEWLTSKEGGSPLVHDLFARHSKESLQVFQTELLAYFSKQSEDQNTQFSSLSDRLLNEIARVREQSCQTQRAWRHLLWGLLLVVGIPISAWLVVQSVDHWRQWKESERVVLLEDRNRQLQAALQETQDRYHGLALQIAKDDEGNWRVLAKTNSSVLKIPQLGRPNQFWVQPETSP